MLRESTSGLTFKIRDTSVPTCHKCTTREGLFPVNVITSAIKLKRQVL